MREEAGTQERGYLSNGLGNGVDFGPGRYRRDGEPWISWVQHDVEPIGCGDELELDIDRSEKEELRIRPGIWT